MRYSRHCELASRVHINRRVHNNRVGIDDFLVSLDIIHDIIVAAAAAAAPRLICFYSYSHYNPAYNKIVIVHDLVNVYYIRKLLSLSPPPFSMRGY